MSTQTGFSARALAFFDGLEENNSRDYWLAHKDVFEREVKAPLAALLASLPDVYQPFRVFRMNRDLRFTNDKSPYKTQHSAIHDAGGIDHYLQFGAGGLLVATGIYWMERDQLERYRAAVADDKTGPALQRLLGRLGDGLDSDMGLAPLKSAPRGFSRDHPRIDLLRRKGVVVHGTLGGAALRDGAAVRAFAVHVLEAGRPLNRWLATHVGRHEADPEHSGRR